MIVINVTEILQKTFFTKKAGFVDTKKPLPHNSLWFKKFNPNILKMEFTGRIFLICELEWEVKLHIYFTNL